MSRRLSGAIVSAGGTNSITLNNTTPHTWTIDMGLVCVTDENNVSWYFQSTRDTEDVKKLPWLQELIKTYTLKRV